MRLRRYACPHCGGGLSRTLFHPKWLSLKSERPGFKLPLLPLLLAIVAVGLGFGLFHPALGFVAVTFLAVWVNWRYFAWFQCDACARFLFGGQLKGGPQDTVQWTRADLKGLTVKLLVLGGLLAAIFLPLRYVEQVTRSHCDAGCAKAGRDGALQLLRCTCVAKAG